MLLCLSSAYRMLTNMKPDFLNVHIKSWNQLMKWLTQRQAKSSELLNILHGLIVAERK